MEVTVPAHHVGQDVCHSRAPYREGRKPKAVKVYTVNQESQYLLVQGVPQVGAIQELVNLFAVYGSIQEYRVLDDYPADKFTDTLLVKFSKIQSARYAKRKLDDWSFYGGVLHICYAPEYESIAETRFKLQERRKAIAAKIRQHAEDRQPVLPSEGEMSHSKTVTRTTQYNFSGKSKCTDRETGQKIVSETDVYNNQGEEQKLGSSRHINEDVQLWLPLPPISNGRQSGDNKQGQFEFARVPSAHSTFPHGFDARIQLSSSIPKSEVSETDSHHPVKDEANFGHSFHKDMNQVKHCSSVVESDGGTGRTTDVQPSTIKPEDQNHSPSHMCMVPGSKDPVIIREFKKQTGSVVRFVPRQAQKRKAGGELNSASKKQSEADSQLKKNTFTLGRLQGPVSSAQSCTNQKSPCEASVNKTRSHIRRKIEQLTQQNLDTIKKRQLEDT